MTETGGTTASVCAHCGGPLGDVWFELDAWRSRSVSDPHERFVDYAHVCSQAHLVAVLATPADQWSTPQKEPASFRTTVGLWGAALIAIVALPVVWVVGLVSVLSRVW